MSFSGEVKEELSRQYPAARHCQIAEVAAMLCLNGRVARNEAGEFSIIFSTENESVAKKYFTLLRKTFKIDTEIFSGNSQGPKRGNTYSVSVSDHEKMMQILKATKMLSPELERTGSFPLASELILQQNCCRRAYLRGAFLMSGSISDPEKFYHLEIVCATEPKAKQLCSIMATFGVDARIVVRKRHYVVYIKEGNQIVDLLNVMEAHRSLMELENIRILKEMRGNVNRQVNCETANINKTVSAALNQIEDITYIRDTVGFDSLPDGLAQIARARLEKPEATLKELGEDLEPPVGKSGVNHRLRKLSDMAKKLRSQGTGNLNGN